jgi:hypothetical protein
VGPSPATLYSTYRTRFLLIHRTQYDDMQTHETHNMTGPGAPTDITVLGPLQWKKAPFSYVGGDTNVIAHVNDPRNYDSLTW